MATTTYSFSDVKITFSFAGFPMYTINGQGIGEISISYINDNTVHDVAADGSVMVSKIRSENANVSVSMQQTSSLHQWMKNAFNHLFNVAPTSAWASGAINITSPAGLFDDIRLTGVSFTKRADQPFQKEGQAVTWNFMAANAQTVGSALPQAAAVVAGRILT